MSILSLSFHSAVGLFAFTCYKYLEGERDELKRAIKDLDETPELYPDELISYFEKEKNKKEDTNLS